MRKGFRQDLCMWIFTQAAGKEANGFSISAPQFLHLTLLLLIYLRKSILKAETICNTFRYCILCKNIYTHTMLAEKIHNFKSTPPAASGWPPGGS